nr:hypothetical protein [Candidatus Njordarchaeum guaymaensis]
MRMIYLRENKGVLGDINRFCFPSDSAKNHLRSSLISEGISIGLKPLSIATTLTLPLADILFEVLLKTENSYVMLDLLIFPILSSTSSRSSNLAGARYWQ